MPLTINQILCQNLHIQETYSLHGQNCDVYNIIPQLPQSKNVLVIISIIISNLKSHNRIKR